MSPIFSQVEVKGYSQCTRLNWSTSQREFQVAEPLDIHIPISDGITIHAVVIKPITDDPVPVILSAHAYAMEDQFTDLVPEGFSHTRGHMEAGDSTFFARRGYAHIIMNVRGTGQSGGIYDNLAGRTITDICEIIQWLADQEWSTGNIGMYGMSYFAIVQNLVAAENPPALKAIFAPYAYTDMYRDRYYHGGILNYGFMKIWLPTLSNPRLTAMLREEIGEEAFGELVDAVKADPDVTVQPFLAEALNDPGNPEYALVAEILAQPLDNEYYRNRSVDYGKKPAVPAYLGSCWGVFGLHLPGAFRSFENWHGPKQLTIGPGVYLDRPIYQYQYESLRWFDHWLKGMDVGINNEKPVRVFIEGKAEWKEGESWPFPETRWTPFYLNNERLLNEHEPFAHSTSSSFTDGPNDRGEAEFWTGGVVEKTEICGPIALNLFAETNQDDVLWFVSLLHRDADGHERLLTRGWLRGSHRELDSKRSTPWQPYHTHNNRKPVPVGEVVEYAIEVRPYGIELQPGEKLGLRIKCACDEAPENLLHAISMGQLNRQTTTQVKIHHSRDFPSNLLLPVTNGNRIGTFISGGNPLPIKIPVAELKKPERQTELAE